MNRLPAIVILLATVVVSLLLGFGAIYLFSFIENRGHWEQLASPPGKVVRLLGGDVDAVVVLTAAGATFEVECRTTEDYPCVREVEKPRDEFQSYCYDEDFPQPRGGVEDRLLTCIEHEYIVRSQYVLRDDGTLWRWNQAIYPFGQLARALRILLLMLILGVFAGIVLVTGRSS